MDTVDYVKPADVAAAMVETGRRKLGLAPRDLLIRGMLSGAILGASPRASPLPAPCRPTRRWSGR